MAATLFAAVPVVAQDPARRATAHLQGRVVAEVDGSPLAGALVEAAHWKNESKELIRGLGVAIEHQFDRWDLTAAEADVALFLLKGLSHKEISTIRGTSERTVREQARSVYRKSGLAGRTSLSAFFLEDLLLPNETIPHEGGTATQTA